MTNKRPQSCSPESSRPRYYAAMEAPKNPTDKRRPVRSFVLRAGRLTAGQKKALEELWPDFGIGQENELLELDTVFGRHSPVTLEIGFGNGENLIDMARNSPDTNFLGIEVHPPGVGHCLLAIDEHKLTNVRLMREDAVQVLRDRIQDHSLARVNLFFPDPWHKKRHHKRRIVQPDFVELLSCKISPGGIFHVATDWQDYAEHINDVMQKSGSFKVLEDFPQDRIKTRFDARGSRLGHENWESAYSNCSK